MYTRDDEIELSGTAVVVEGLRWERDGEFVVGDVGPIPLTAWSRNLPLVGSSTAAGFPGSILNFGTTAPASEPGTSFVF